VGAIGSIWLLIHLFFGSGKDYVPPGTPHAVLVTVFDTKDTTSFKSAIMDNRRDYASRHGMRSYKS